MKLSFLPKIAVFALLCLLSAAAHFNVARYFPVGEQLLANSDFAKGLEGWEIKAPEEEMVTVSGGEVKIEAADEAASPLIFQTVPVPLPGRTVGLAVTARSADITPGEKPWYKGRILFVQYRQGKAIYNTYHEAASFRGTDDWQKYTAYFHLLPGVSEARVMLVLNRVAGGLYCRELSLFQVTANPMYSLAKWALLAGWLLFAVILFSPVLTAATRGKGRIRPALAALTLALTLTGIIVGTTIPGSMKNDLKADVIEEVKTYSDALSIPVISTTKKLARKFTTSYSVIDITKWAHFGLFGMLTLLLFWHTPQPNPSLILADILMLACGTELAQLFVENRGTHLTDIGVDMAGSVAGLVVWLALRRYLHRAVPHREACVQSPR